MLSTQNSSLEIHFSFFCRSSHSYQNGENPIVLRVVYRRQRKDVFTGMTLVIGLASLIIGNAILPTSKHKFLLTLLSAVLGSIGYQFALGIALRMGFQASDLKLITGLIVIIAISFSKIKLLKR